MRDPEQKIGQLLYLVLSQREQTDGLFKKWGRRAALTRNYRSWFQREVNRYSAARFSGNGPLRSARRARIQELSAQVWSRYHHGCQV